MADDERIRNLQMQMEEKKEYIGILEKSLGVAVKKNDEFLENRLSILKEERRTFIASVKYFMEFVCCKLSKPKEEKILDLPSPGQKRHSLQPPTRTAPAPNTFKPINTLNHRVSPTPPNRLPPSPTSPFSHPHSNSPRRISTPSPTPPCRPPPSAPGLSNSNVDRLTPSPTPPMRIPPSVPDSNRGRPSPSPPPKFFPQSHERSNSGGKGPPIRPPVSYTHLMYMYMSICM
ncbi:vegetative cell wall protein gp1-like [Anneissia japonica]|uniref:vegetative cell wall protein gp1-like n=1 Tax=Anneissia japonica TaxID=1529436 RepID=UPI001425674E|nr:vegetative cell wall protein gp1-like [Anneissia japonica]